ncbi:MAG: hypothetical protein CSA26_02840 [Desulfobacterales bacterium]|nr:MAG: hypothetical protein CSA26_02840 [Desulfobacterales bacterium]
MFKAIRAKLRAKDWETARKKDLYYCYRLLLGRKPDIEGWNTFMADIARGGITIQRLVRYFLSSPEFKNNQRNDEISKKMPVEVELEGFSMYVAPPDGAIGKYIIDNHIWEPHVTKTLYQLIKPGMVFVDIGANIGYFSMLAAKMVGSSGKVIAFEPDQFNSSLLYLNAQKNSFANIEIYPFAVAESKKIVVYDNLDGNGTISNPGDDMTTLISRTVVHAVKLDDLLREENAVDIIKIDIEGSEHLALLGATALIKRHRPVIVTEFTPGGLQNISGVSAEKFLQHITDLNYTLSAINTKGERRECGTSTARVLSFFKSQKQGHIEILAEPR